MSWQAASWQTGRRLGKVETLGKADLSEVGEVEMKRLVRAARLFTGTAAQLLAGAAVLLYLAGCAQIPTDPDALAEYQERNDPLEPANRVVWQANQFVDRNLLRPVAVAYRDTVPDDIRTGVHNAVTNLGEPLVFVNDVLQANMRRAWIAVARFLVNSTVGLAGVIDVAGKMGIPHHDADFGQTLGVWGVSGGPYLMLPLLGPSSLRDATGLAAGFYADPVNLLARQKDLEPLTYGRTGVETLDQRTRLIETLDDVERNSFDYYAAMRSLSQQKRATDIKDGLSPPPDSIPKTSHWKK